MRKYGKEGEGVSERQRERKRERERETTNTKNTDYFACSALPPLEATVLQDQTHPLEYPVPPDTTVLEAELTSCRLNVCVFSVT